MSAGCPADWPAPLVHLCALLAPGPAPELPGLSGQDWGAFTELVIARHRVAPLIGGLLDAGAVPEATRAAVIREMQANAAQVLGQMAVTKDIMAAMAGQNIRPVLLKGWPLAEDLFGAPGKRHARDLDLLVLPGEVSGAAEVLGAMGFNPAPVYRLRGRLIGSAALTEECYDLEFHHPDGLAVELHWRTNHLPGWPDLMAHQDMIRTQPSAIGPVRVLTDTANLIYLSGHGGMHVWARLKWLVDIAHLAARRGPEGLEADLRRARALKVDKPVTVALRLSARLFGTPLPPGIVAPDGAASGLEAHVLRVIADPRAAPGTLRYKALVHMAPLRLAGTFGQAAGVLRYAIWRRIRLGVAGLRAALGHGPAQGQV